MKLIGIKRGTYTPDGGNKTYPWCNLCFLVDSPQDNVIGEWCSILKVSQSFVSEASGLKIGGNYEPYFDQYGKVLMCKPS